MQAQKFKIQLTIAFFAVVNHNYGDSQRTLKTETNEMVQNLPITTDTIVCPGWIEHLFSERTA